MSDWKKTHNVKDEALTDVVRDVVPNVVAGVVPRKGVKAVTNKIAYDLKDYIATYPDYPKQWIQFRDISPMLAHPFVMDDVMEQVIEKVRAMRADVVALMDARGFHFRVPGKPAIMVRKKSKLPGDIVRQKYKKEYWFDSIEMQKNTIRPGDKVVIVDDLLATGWTMNAAAKLIEKLWWEIVWLLAIIQLNDPYCAGSRKKKHLERYHIDSLVQYDE